MIKLLRQTLYFGLLFGLFQCYGAEQPTTTCMMGDNGTTLVRLNEIYHQATGHYMEHGCLDPKGEFPDDAITFKDGFKPNENPAQFILDLFQACNAHEYKTTHAAHNLPKLEILNERFQHHIFIVLFVKNNFSYNEPQDAIDMPDGPKGPKYHAHFLCVDREIADYTKKPLEARLGLWESIGFHPLIVGKDLQLPINGKPAVVGADKSRSGGDPEKCVVQ